MPLEVFEVGPGIVLDSRRVVSVHAEASVPLSMHRIARIYASRSDHPWWFRDACAVYTKDETLAEWSWGSYLSASRIPTNIPGNSDSLAISTAERFL